MEALAGEFEGVDEEDPRQAARLMRKLYDATGMKLGAGVEEAIRRMESGEDPDKIEKDVESVLPKERWRRFSDLLIYHGREVCKARKADHERCAILNLCPSNTI